MHGYFKRSKFVISYSLSKLATVDLFSFSKKVHFEIKLLNPKYYLLDLTTCEAIDWLTG